MRKLTSSDELIDQLAILLGVSGNASIEIRWNDELFKRRVLRSAIDQVERSFTSIGKDKVSDYEKSLKLIERLGAIAAKHCHRVHHDWQELTSILEYIGL